MELGQVLAALPEASADPNLILGALASDDAAVYRIAPDRALVATVDFFTPVVDDPEAYGAIAAANALSDVYAMGARPLFALNLLAFPRDKLGTGLLERIVRGGAAKMQEAETPIVGGHSIDDPEPKFGYAVTGEVHPDRLITTQGARPGDVLFLTKPLGTGLINTAIKRGLCPPQVARKAIELMSTLNKAASEAMLAAGAHAATDVTGFGLIGHLLNMLRGDVPPGGGAPGSTGSRRTPLRVGAEISNHRVPLIGGVRELAEKDLFPSGSGRNFDATQARVDWQVPELERRILTDAQTSGGLLISLPPGASFELGVEIGRVVEGDRVTVVP